MANPLSSKLRKPFADVESRYLRIVYLVAEFVSASGANCHERLSLVRGRSNIIKLMPGWIWRNRSLSHGEKRDH